MARRRAIYEGRSINKLQNGAIPSVLKIGKNPKYTFCREFNSEHTYNFSRMFSACIHADTAHERIKDFFLMIARYYYITLLLLLHKPLLGIADLRHANKESRFIILQADRRVFRGRWEAVVGRFNSRPRDTRSDDVRRWSGRDVLVTLTSSIYNETDEYCQEDRDDEDDTGSTTKNNSGSTARNDSESTAMNDPRSTTNKTIKTTTTIPEVWRRRQRTGSTARNDPGSTARKTATTKTIPEVPRGSLQRQRRYRKYMEEQFRKYGEEDHGDNEDDTGSRPTSKKTATTKTIPEVRRWMIPEVQRLRPLRRRPRYRKYGAEDREPEARRGTIPEVLQGRLRQRRRYRKYMEEQFRKYGEEGFRKYREEDRDDEDYAGK